VRPAKGSTGGKCNVTTMGQPGQPPQSEARLKEAGDGGGPPIEIFAGSKSHHPDRGASPAAPFYRRRSSITGLLGGQFGV
jgi:hypothetical protein